MARSYSHRVSIQDEPRSKILGSSVGVGGGVPARSERIVIDSLRINLTPVTLGSSSKETRRRAGRRHWGCHWSKGERRQILVYIRYPYPETLKVGGLRLAKEKYYQVQEDRLAFPIVFCHESLNSRVNRWFQGSKGKNVPGPWRTARVFPLRP